MIDETIAPWLGYGLFLLVAVIFAGVLTFLLDQRRCPACGSTETHRYPESRTCPSCGKSWT